MSVLWQWETGNTVYKDHIQVIIGHNELNVTWQEDL